MQENTNNKIYVLKNDLRKFNQQYGWRFSSDTSGLISSLWGRFLGGIGYLQHLPGSNNSH